MRSPKFKFIKKDLDDAFAHDLLKEEWKSRVRYQIRKQLLFDPIEYRDYNETLDEEISRLRDELLSGRYSVRTTKRYLSEKSRGLCRQMTLVHPIDLLVLERLSRSLYFELLEKAPSSSAFFEPDDGNFKKGFQQIDFSYGSFASWRKFQKRVLGFAEENNFVVISDVANFYDFINFQHLRNIVSSLAEIRESLLDLLIYVLNRMTWTPDFMPMTQVGMPQIETTATRVLANAMLYEMDRVCETSAVNNYARFMDDIDVGVDSIPAAKAIVRDIDLTLQSRQLRLNSSKTKILRRKDAFAHFCVSENEQLMRFEKIIERLGARPVLRRILLRKYESWLEREGNGEPGARSVFKNGNGSKIHKYLLRLIDDVGGRVPSADLLWLVKNDPAMRSTALRYLPASRSPNTDFNKIYEEVIRGTFVDEASLVEITNYLLHARFKVTQKQRRQIRHLVSWLSSSGDIALHCAILLSARFLFPAEILRLMKRRRDQIRSDFWLARAAAGLAPRFLGNGHFHSLFLDEVRGFRNEDAERVLTYLMEISQTTSLSNSLKAYVRSANPAYPQDLYFPKILILLALEKNPHVNALFLDRHTVHPSLRNDPYYKKMGF